MARKAEIPIILSNGKQAGQTINELRQQANRLNKEINDLKPGSEKFVRKSKDFKLVTGRLSKVRKEVKGVESAFKKTGGFIKKFGAQFTAFLGLGAIVQGLRQAISTIRDFQQANANLASILGKTRKEISLLTEDAKKLGSQTSFSATQVSELQTEFARLGFTESEILKVTKATLRLAEATGTELSQAAEVTGATLRAFEMDSSQTQRVVDVMAKSFSSSSLNMEKFSTAMASVAPVAKTAGLNIEKTTAMLGLLSDRGLDASTAGTSLRNILLKLSEEGITFDEAMQRINSSVDKNATALKLFGTRGATSAVILSQNAAAANELELSLNKSAGAADKMANEQLNTLNGKVKILQSSWEGLILSLESGDGTLAKSARGAIEFITNAINGLTTLDTRIDLMFKDISELSDVQKTQLIELGILESGSSIKEVIDNAFSGISNRDIISDFNKSKEIFTEALMQEGESLEDSLQLFRIFYRERLSLYQSDVKAQQDAFNASKKAREEQQAILAAKEAADREKLNKDNKSRADKEAAEAEKLNRLDASLDMEYDATAAASDRLKNLSDEVTKHKLENIDKVAEAAITSEKFTLANAGQTAGAMAGIFGNLAGLQEEGSKSYKSFAQIQARMAAFQAAINAYQSTAAIPVVGPALAPVAAATALAFGMKQASMIGKQNPGTPSGGGGVSAGGASISGLNVGAASTPPRIETSATRTNRPPVASGASASTSSQESSTDRLIEAFENRITTIEVINRVQDTIEGINVINKLEKQANV